MNSPRTFLRFLVRPGCFALGWVAIAGLSSPRVLAQSAWVGPSGTTTAPTTGSWNTASNWSPNGVPVSGSTTELDFSTGTATYTSTDNISGAFQLNILTLATGAGTSTATIAGTAGTSLDFVANGLTAPVINANSNGQFTFNTTTAITLDGALTLKGSGTGTVYIQALIGGSGSLAKSSSAQLTLTNGSNSYSGGTTLTAGTISVQASGALGGGSVSLGGGKLSLYNTQSESNTIGVTANSTIEAAVNTGGAATQTMTVTGGVSVASGTILTLTNTSNGTVTSLGTVSTAITGSGSVLKGGAGQGIGWLLSGNNSYTGTTSVTATTLAITGTTSGQGNYTVTNNSTNGTAGTLAGNGTIGLVSGGTIAVTGLNANVQAAIAPSVPTTTSLNSGIGTLNLVWAATNSANAATFGNYSTLAIDVGASGSSDRLNIGSSAVTGKLTLSSMNSTLALTSGTGAFDGSNYIVANYFGTLSGTFAALTVNGTTQASPTSFTANGFTYNVDYGLTDPNGGFDIELVAATVPEPAPWIGALALLFISGLHPRTKSAWRGLVRR